MCLYCHRERSACCVTTNQLQEALAITKKMNKSVEFVLVDRFGVKKEDVGKSLSQYFGCPFRDFDEEFPIPFELIGKLKKSFLLYYVWVPLSWSKKGVEILVDDPKDLRKTDHIKALMTNQKIILSVGFKEDIDKYIAHFFDPRAETTTTTDFDDLDDILPDVTFEEEEEIDLIAVRKEREALKKQLEELETEMDGYLKELGYDS